MLIALESEFEEEEMEKKERERERNEKHLKIQKHVVLSSKLLDSLFISDDSLHFLPLSLFFSVTHSLSLSLSLPRKRFFSPFLPSCISHQDTHIRLSSHKRSSCSQSILTLLHLLLFFFSFFPLSFFEKKKTGWHKHGSWEKREWWRRERK